MNILCRNSEAIAQPGGHYSHICIAGGQVYISGQLPIQLDGTKLTDCPFEDQVTQVLANIDECLKCAGIDRQSLVQLRIYITDMQNWPRFDQLYAAWIGSHRPARAVAGVSELHFGLTVEIEATAFAPEP